MGVFKLKGRTFFTGSFSTQRKVEAFGHKKAKFERGPVQRRRH